MSEKRFELSEYSTVYRYSVIDNIQKGTLKANEIIILLSKQAEKIDEQQATIEAKDKEIAELDQQCADFLGDKIKALEEFEECTDKLKAKIVEQQATINQSIALQREIKDLKEENEKLTKMLNANYKTNNELVQYIQMLERDNDE